MCEQTTEQVTRMTYTGDNEAMRKCFAADVLFDNECGLQHYVSHRVAGVPVHKDLVMGMALTRHQDGTITAR